MDTHKGGLSLSFFSRAKLQIKGYMLMESFADHPPPFSRFHAESLHHFLNPLSTRVKKNNRD